MVSPLLFVALLISTRIAFCRAGSLQAEGWQQSLHQQQHDNNHNLFSWEHLNSVELPALPVSHEPTRMPASFSSQSSSPFYGQGSTTGYYNHVSQATPHDNDQDEGSLAFPSTPLHHYLDDDASSFSYASSPHVSFNDGQSGSSLHEGMDVEAGYAYPYQGTTGSSFAQHHPMQTGAGATGLPSLALEDDLDSSDGEFFEKSRQPVLKAQIRRLWQQKGLWVGMPAKEMAAGLAEIRVQLGKESPRSVSSITAHHVRMHPRATKEYITDVSSVGFQITKRINRLNDNLKKQQPLLGKEERDAIILTSLRFLHDREAYRDHARGPREDRNYERMLDREARSTWNRLVHSPEFSHALSASGYDPTTILAQDIPLSIVESASRYLDNREYSSYLIRRYLYKDLHKTPDEVEVFNKARNGWLKAHQHSLRAAS